MPALRLDGDDVVVHLTALEKVFALRGDLRVPRSAVRTVRRTERAGREVHGVRAPGTAIPGLVALGTWRRRGGKDFCAVYGRRPGVVVELADFPFRRLILSPRDADRVYERLRPLVPVGADDTSGGTAG